MNKEQGTKNKEQGTKIVQGLDTDNSDMWMGQTFKFFQTIYVCTEICHG